MNPCHLTAYPHRLGATGVVILVDSDALVLRHLTEALRNAQAGKICLFRDPDDTRFFPEWAEIFGLERPLRRQPYFNTGLVAFSTEAWPDLLRRWWEVLQRIWDRPSFMEGASLRRDPVSQPDQDALNALLMSEFPSDAVHELAPSSNVFPAGLPEVRIEDLEALHCTRDGAPVDVLQCSGGPKPWTWQSVWTRRQTHAYLDLLRRTVAWDDVAMKPPNRLLPPWLRRGAMGRAAFSGVDAVIRAPGVRSALRRAGILKSREHPPGA